jgi:branched-subunit amino acid transport protein
MTLADGYAWAAIGGLVVVVFVTRNVFMALPRRLHPSGTLERALRVAPLAALVALTVPAAAEAWLAPGAGWLEVWQDGRLPAAVVTLAVARAAGTPFPGLAAGVAVLLAIGGLG